MKTAQYKGKVLGNSVNVFNYYKQIAGNGLQQDLAILNSKNALILKLSSQKDVTPEDLVEASKIDSASIISNLYVALRKAGDPTVRRDTTESILDELEFEDLQDPELTNVIVGLLTTKKK